MARWYARFDSGGFNGANWNSGYVPSDFTYREQVRIGLAFGAGDRFRNGLIDSRSILSAEAYDDLTGIYRNGGFGVIAPGDLFSQTIPTFVSFSAVYTSSLTNPPAAGIITPSDYATRPTASVTSAEAPLRLGAIRTQGVGVTYNAYKSASDAVVETLNACQTGDGTAKTPYTRPGLNPSRTAHSIYHDPDVQYFAWDDFTPGTPQNVTVSIPESVAYVDYAYPGASRAVYLESGDPFNIVFSWSPEYKADRAGTAMLTASVVRDDNSALITSLEQPVTNGDLFYSWSQAGVLASYAGPGVEPYGYDYDINSSVKFRDAIITTHTGSAGTDNEDKFVRVFTLTAKSLYYGAPGDGLANICSATTPSTYYLNGISTSFGGASAIWVNKTGGYASGGDYAETLPGPGTTVRRWDGNQFYATTTCP